MKLVRNLRTVTDGYLLLNLKHSTHLQFSNDTIGVDLCCQANNENNYTDDNIHTEEESTVCQCRIN